MKTPDSVREWYAAMGRKSRAAQLANSTPEQRSERARRAAQARWAGKHLYVGYNATDSHGAAGWWQEGKTTTDVVRSAQKTAAEFGFDEAPTLRFVDLTHLNLLSLEELSDLVTQWKLSRRNGWTSIEADELIAREIKKRVE